MISSDDLGEIFGHRLHPARVMMAYANLQSENPYDDAKHLMDIQGEFGVTIAHVVMVAEAPFNQKNASLVMMVSDIDPSTYDTYLVESGFAQVRQELLGMGMPLVDVATNPEPNGKNFQVAVSRDYLPGSAPSSTPSPA